MPVAPSASQAPRVGPPDFGSTMSANPEAVAAYRAGMQAFRDGAGDAARKHFEKAAELDPAFAAAHLRRMVLSDKADGTAREYATKASQARSSLSDHDRALLDAYLPWTGVPQESAESERKLAALFTANPEDADYAYHLCRMRVFMGNPKGDRACAEAYRLDSGLVDALHLKALTLSYLNDVDGSIKAFDQCFKASRLATSCLRELTMLLSSEGRCDEAVQTARRWVAIDPTEPTPYRALGYALYGAGQPIESAREAFEQAWTRMSAENRAIDQGQVLSAMDELTGDFASADRRLRDWDSTLSKSTEEWDHAGVTLWRLGLLAELGRKAEAATLAASYMKRRSAWAPPPDQEMSIFIRSIQYRIGAISRAEFRRARDEWLAREAVRENTAGRTPGANWLIAYALPAMDEEDAREALDVFPRFAPLPEPVRRLPDFDEAAANVYLLMNRNEEALQFAQRAARSCFAFDSAIESTRAHYVAGQALERLGRKSQACDEYGVILRRWGGSAEGGTTAARTKQAFAQLRCRR
jgi:tetratricopeptide (TPR) repeat protein